MNCLSFSYSSSELLDDELLSELELDEDELSEFELSDELELELVLDSGVLNSKLT